MKRHPIRLGDRQASKGAAYLLMLFSIASALAISAKVVELGAIEDQRRAEQRLINVGLAYRAALESYARITPAGQPTAPQSVQQLLRDDRFPGVVRHLRKEYKDPVLPGHSMVTMRDAQDGITAFRSDSTDQPINKQFNGRVNIDSESVTRYRDWVF